MHADVHDVHIYTVHRGLHLSDVHARCCPVIMHNLQKQAAALDASHVARDLYAQVCWSSKQIRVS